MADLPANKLAKAVLTTTKQELANLIADGQSECAKQGLQMMDLSLLVI